jgi:PAS domain S-box-containing protein
MLRRWFAPQADGSPRANPARVVAAVGAAVLGVLLLTFAALGWHEYEEERHHVDERNALLGRLFIDAATRNVEAAALAAATLAEPLTRGTEPDGPEIRAAMAQTLVNLPFLRSLGIVDATGWVLSATEGAAGGSVLDLAPLGPMPEPGRDRLGRFVAGRGLADLLVGSTSSTQPAGVGFLPLVYGVAMPHGQRVYLVALINASAFATFQQASLGDDDAAAAITTFDGQLVAATRGVSHVPGSSVAGLAPFTRFLPAREHGLWAGEGLRPGEQQAAFRVSATRPIAVLVEYSARSALRNWLAKIRNILVAAALALAFVALMMAVAIRSANSREQAYGRLASARAQVMHREQELNVTVRSLQELIFRTDVRGVFTFANERRWSAVAGKGVVVGAHLWDFVDAAQRDAARALFDLDLADSGVRRAQLVIRGKGTADHTFDVSVMPLIDRGAIVGFAGSAVDVSALVAAEQRLRAQLAFTAELIEASPMPSSVTDADRRYLLVNRAWEAFTGRRREDAVGHEAGAHLAPHEREASQREDREVLATGLPARYEAVYVHADGSPRDVVVNKLRVPDHDGRPAGVMSVVMDVTEFREAERATTAARVAAEEASSAKSEFIANISHELRTPLQSIIGFSELGGLRAREHERFAAMFGDIHSAGRRMLALVNDLLDVAKIESAIGSVDLERSDLRPLLREVADELRVLAGKRGQSIDLELPESPVLAKVDPSRLQQVMRNLLANALRFAPDGSHVQVQAGYNAKAEPRFSVCDRGPGVPEAELESIFEAFVQSSRTKDGSGGTGLGLAICRKIVQAHGGRIHAENRAGGGAAFHVVLPARGEVETLPSPL